MSFIDHRKEEDGLMKTQRKDKYWRRYIKYRQGWQVKRRQLNEDSGQQVNCCKGLVVRYKLKESYYILHFCIHAFLSDLTIPE